LIINADSLFGNFDNPFFASARNALINERRDSEENEGNPNLYDRFGIHPIPPLMTAAETINPLDAVVVDRSRALPR
jgi:hypothetical protein